VSRLVVVAVCGGLLVVAGAQAPADPVAALIADTRARGADPDFYTAGARWEREADIPDAIYFRAMEAVG